MLELQYRALLIGWYNIRHKLNKNHLFNTDVCQNCMALMILQLEKIPQYNQIYQELGAKNSDMYKMVSNLEVDTKQKTARRRRTIKVNKLWGPNPVKQRKDEKFTKE